jgi:excisionase family DNA binding protein
MADLLNLPDPHDLAMEDIAPAIAQLAGLQTALAARLISERLAPAPEEEDVLLTVKQAAELLNLSPAFLYKRSKTLPFTKHIHRRGLRFSRRGITAWLARKR